MALEKPLASFQDRLEYWRRIGDRAADCGEHFDGGPLLVERFLGLVEQPRVLDRDHRLIGEGLEQRDVLFGKGPDIVAADDDSADALALPDHRSNEPRLHANGAGTDANAGRHIRVVRYVGIMQDDAASDCPTGTAFALGESSIVYGGLELFPIWTVVGRHVNAPILAQEVDRNHLAREQPLSARQNLLENRRRVGDRAADRGEHFAGGALLLERFLGLVEQAHVLEGDRRLVAEGLEQRNLSLGECTNDLPAQHDCPDRMTFTIEWRNEDRAMAEALRQIVTDRIFGSLRLHVGNLNRSALEQSPARYPVAAYRQRADGGGFIGHNLRRDGMAQRFAIGEEYRGRGSITKALGTLSNGIEY